MLSRRERKRKVSNNKEKKQEVAQEDLEKETSKVEEGKD